MGKRGRADLALVGPVGAVGDEIDPELAFRRLDRRIDLARRHVEALGVELEMMDQGFHGALHHLAPGRNDLVVGEYHGTLALGQAQLLQALLHDADGLAHLLHAHEVTVIAVAVLADRNVELHFRVAFVGLRLAQVPGGARAAHHHAGKAPVPGILLADDCDLHIALLEDAIVGEQALDVVANDEERVAEVPDVVDELRRQILMHAAGAEIIGVHAGARGALVEHHQLLALLEAPQRRGERADVHGLGRDIEQMREQPADLAIEYADELRAPGHVDPQQPLRRQAERMLLVHRRHIVEPIEIGQSLQIGLVFDQFLGSAVQQADVRIDALDHLAVELEHEAQYAVRGRVLRPEIDGEIAERRLVHPGSLKPVGPAVAVLRPARPRSSHRNQEPHEPMRQVRRTVSPAQVRLNRIRITPPAAPLDFPSPRRTSSPPSAASQRTSPRSGARARGTSRIARRAPGA